MLSPMNTPSPDDPSPTRLVLPGQRLRAGAGADWIADGWRLFRRAKVMWIAFVVLFFLLSLAVSLLPAIGSLLGALLSPVILGGIMLGARSLETGGELELEHFLAGFRSRTASLVAVGAIYLAGQLLLMVVFAGFVGFSVLGALIAGDAGALAGLDVGESLLRAGLGGLVVMALAVPLFAAFWFAPALVMINGLPAAPAMRESLVACLRNWLPMLVYGILASLLLVLALIPLLLGLVVWAPLMLATLYTSYRGVFTQPETAAA